MAGLWIHFTCINWKPDLVNSIERTQLAHKIIVEVAQFGVFAKHQMKCRAKEM
jgi:hypothetical protein